VERRVFTRKELRRYNGMAGAPAYVAYEGIVYDVSRSFHWQNGRHHVLHFAGTDLTRRMRDAPHGADLLRRFPVVGELEQTAKSPRRGR